MIQNLVRIRELAGWGFDSYKHRPEKLEQSSHARASKVIAQRSPFVQSDAVLGTEPKQLQELFEPYTKRPDLVSEMSGLSWSLGVVDLRQLIAFQRRLTFSPAIGPPSIPQAKDWPSLCAISFASPKSIECAMTYDDLTQTVVFQSANPNLHLRVTNDPAFPLSVHAGGTFFEVACFRNRWFLRDGYHRAYALLEANIFEVPAVIVQAATLEELGANQAWFFPEEVLFSDAPPRVIDFLNEYLVLEYERAPFIKTLRIKMEETLVPAISKGEQ